MVLIALTKTYALRMGAVFMISLATIWLKTGLMPVAGHRDLCSGTGDSARHRRQYVDHAGVSGWVLVVSVLLLVRAGVIDLDRDDVSQDAAPDDGHGLTASRALSSSASGMSSTSTTTMPSSS